MYKFKFDSAALYAIDVRTRSNTHVPKRELRGGVFAVLNTRMRVILK